MCFFNTLCGKGYLGFFMVGTAINWPPKAAILFDWHETWQDCLENFGFSW